MGIQTRGVAGVKTTTDFIRQTSYTPEEAKRELARLTRIYNKGSMKPGSFAAFQAHITRRTVANGHAYKPKAKAAPAAKVAPAAKPWKGQPLNLWLESGWVEELRAVLGIKDGTPYRHIVSFHIKRDRVPEEHTLIASTLRKWTEANGGKWFSARGRAHGKHGNGITVYAVEFPTAKGAAAFERAWRPSSEAGAKARATRLRPQLLGAP
jgi:hypothetical protein